MVCPNCGAEIPGRAARREWKEIIGKIHDLEKEWKGKKLGRSKMSVEGLVEKIQNLTEEIRLQITPEDYGDVMAYVEGEIICKKYKGDSVWVILERVLLILTVFFPCLYWFFENCLESDWLIDNAFIGNYTLFICLMLVCLAVIVCSRIWYAPHDRKRIFYELLYNSLERGREKQHHTGMQAGKQQ